MDPKPVTPEQDAAIKSGGRAIAPLGRATEAARTQASRALEIVRERLDVDLAPYLESEEDVYEWERQVLQAAADLAEAGLRLRTLADLASAKLACWAAVAEDAASRPSGRDGHEV